MFLYLNKISCFLPPQRFRIETFSVVLPQLSRQDWAVTIVLQDAYLHVPIHLRSRRLLGFFPSGNLLPVPGSSFRTSGLSLGVLPLGSGRLCIDSLHLIHSNLAS